MHTSRLNFLRFVTLVLATCFLMGVSTPASAQDRTRSNVHPWWDAQKVVGRSMLQRSQDGLKVGVRIFSRSIEPDTVLTMWIMVFNTPGGCATSPCSVLDLENPAANADWLYGGGIVTSGSLVLFGGSLGRDDDSGSGWIELGFPDFAMGVTDPENAEVMLAIHSHGPAGSGSWLKNQMSSYLGGCLTFLGPGGFASGPEDIPDEVNECSTIYYSIHQP